MLDKRVEDKRIGNAVELNIQHNSAIGPADCRPLLTQIEPIDSTVGPTASQRMGDKIKPKRLTVKGVLSITNTQRNTQSPVYARVMILSQKDIKVSSQVIGGAVDTAHLLKPSYTAGGPAGDEIAFTGAALDLITPINTDKFRVYYDKVIKLCPTRDGAEENPGSAIVWKARLKTLPATFTFDNGNGNWVNNFAPFCCIGYAYADGTGPDVLTTRLISNYQSQLTFEDA